MPKGHKLPCHSGIDAAITLLELIDRCEVVEHLLQHAAHAIVFVGCLRRAVDGACERSKLVTNQAFQNFWLREIQVHPVVSTQTDALFMGILENRQKFRIEKHFAVVRNLNLTHSWIFVDQALKIRKPQVSMTNGSISMACG